jgi:hypothetical protein
MQGLSVILKAIETDKSEDVRTKCLGCLSSVLKHNPAAMDALLLPKGSTYTENTSTSSSLTAPSSMSLALAGPASVSPTAVPLPPPSTIASAPSSTTTISQTASAKTGLHTMLDVLNLRTPGSQKGQKRVMFFWGSAIRESLADNDTEHVLAKVVKVEAGRDPRWASLVLGCLEDTSQSTREVDVDLVETGLNLLVGLAEVDSSLVSGVERGRAVDLLDLWVNKSKSGKEEDAELDPEIIGRVKEFLG